MAGIWERAAMIAKSSINDILDGFEDPEKVINQTVIDAKEEYAKAKAEAATVLANERMVKDKMDSANQDADKWHSVAASALKAGNEADARKALSKENEYRSRADDYRQTYEASKLTADKVRQNLNTMKIEIEEMEDKAAQVKAKAATAKTYKSAEKVLSRGIKEGAFEAFERMEQKADRQLAEAEAMQDLNADEGADEEIDLLKRYSGANQDTDDALASLKAELGV